MANDEQLSIFDENENENDNSGKSKDLPVAKVEFLEGKDMNWHELFEGFSSVKIITFSSSLDFLKKVIALFDDAEVIFGCQEIMPYRMAEIMAFQSTVIDTVRKSEFRDFFIERLKKNTLRLYVAREKISHEKLYLLSSQDGRKRVITGSANMSNMAFYGGQRENIVYMDGDNAYEWYSEVYERCRTDCTDKITEDTVLLSENGENLESLPVAKTAQSLNILEIRQDLSDADEIKFALEIDKRSRRFASVAPKTEKNAGCIVITPQNIRSLRQNIEKKQKEEKIARQEYPMLHIDTDRKEITLNEKVLDLDPSEEEIRNDVSLFMQFMEGYQNFSGNWEDTRKRYYEFANWFFCSPFMAMMRNTARLHDIDCSSYPIFGILYGKSKAGKTTFLKMLLKMMIGQSPIIAGKEFTKTAGDFLRSRVEGVPIVTDDIMKKRFDEHAPELIKNDDFGYKDNLTNYPAIVFSANTDMETVKKEYSRRTVCINVTAGGLTEDMRSLSTMVNRISKRMGTAFYREYLSQMLGKVPALIEGLKKEDLTQIPDIMKISSEIIFDIIEKYSGSENLPDYVRKLQYNDYFSSAILGKNMKEKIRKAWENNRKCFRVNTKQNRLSYDTGSIYESKKICDELPDNLEAEASRELVMMRLDRAKEFFGIDFRRTLFR